MFHNISVFFMHVTDWLSGGKKNYEKKDGKSVARIRKSCTFAPAFDNETEGRKRGCRERVL